MNKKKTTAKKPTTKKNTTSKTKTASKGGTKADYLLKHGIKIRPVTAKDKQYAQTDYQKKANCIITLKGRQFFSKNGSLADCKSVVKMTQSNSGSGKNGKK